MISMSEQIRIMRVKQGNLSERELAERLGETKQNLNNKMRRDDFKVSELNAIATALGYEMAIKFTNTKTGEEL